MTEQQHPITPPDELVEEWLREQVVYSGVSQLFSTDYAFAALKDDGSVITWGDSSWGGDSSSVAGDLQSGVSQIFSTGSAFAALKDDGSVITWGSYWGGGDIEKQLTEAIRSTQEDN